MIDAKNWLRRVETVLLMLFSMTYDACIAFSEEIDWKSRILAGHARIVEIRSNSVVKLRYDRPLQPTLGTELQQLWYLDGRYKVHKLELPERVSREAALAEPRLMEKPDLLRVVTPEYEFSLNRFARDDEGNTILGPLKVKTTAIAKNDLKAWQKRMLWQFTVNAWAATTFCDYDSQGFFAEPPTSSGAFGWNVKKFTISDPQHQLLPSGLLRMSFTTHKEMDDSHNVQSISDQISCFAELDPAADFRVVRSEAITRATRTNPGETGRTTWFRFQAENEYSPTFGRGVIPTRVVITQDQSPTREGLDEKPFEIDEYLIDKVEFGTVTPADFRGEPYGVPASLIEQDPLPPPAVWWWLWLCGLLGVNALLGLAWWFKRRRERLV